MGEINGATPQQVDQAALRASYANKMCPILSMVGLRPGEPSKIVGPLGGAAPAEPSGDAVGCQGPNCMWFTPISDEHGVIRGGGCAVTLLPTAISQIQGAVSGVVQVGARFLSDYKIKPRI